jgi:hypothetical protein
MQEDACASTLGGLAAASVALLAAFLVTSSIGASPAKAALGFELNTSTPSLSLGTKFPHGLAVDQVSRRLYAAVVTNEPNDNTPGEIARFESNGAAAGTFSAGGNAYFSGVAVNPVTQGFYGAEARIESPFGNFGTAQMDPFSSAGVQGTSFALSNTATLPQIATDSSGDVYYPNAATDTVQVFSAAGALQEEIDCVGCTGGDFGKPVSVALNSEDDLYVVDLAPDRVVKLTLSGGSYAFDSVLQSGRGAAGIGVDPSTDDVFVGDLPKGRDYHIVAYDSSGVQFDDFGASLFTNPDPQLGALVGAQIAADATTHRLYVGEKDKVYIFEKVTINPPTATTNAATAIHQLGATLNATVNAKGHAVLDCAFEYVDEGEFQANGFANALDVQCSKLPNGSSNEAVSATLSGLPPSTKYHFRVAAANNAGSVTASEKTFTTLPELPPTVTTDPATGVTQTGATLRGRVNPHGGTVSDCHFDYGPTSSYGFSLPCDSSTGPGTVEVAKKAAVASLSASTTYHYRLVVSTNAGSVQGNDVMFTTPAFPPPPVTPAPPPPPPEAETPPPVTSPPLTCRRGFVKRRVGGKLTCVRKCPKGFVRKVVRRKVRCVKRAASRAGRR